jgi:ABC-type glycerol-3-phosphate transport system substrate-binding protein
MFRQILLVLILSLFSVAAYAGCGINSGSVRVIANDFPAIHAVGDAAEECDGGGVEISINYNKDHKDIHVAALTANPAEFTSSIVANSTFVDLHNNGLIRPLNEYVEKYGDGISKNQLITIDGKVMAVAFMANSAHLFYREDVLKAAGQNPPKSFEELLTVAKAIKDKGLMEHPLGGVFKSGWNVGNEFVNLYLGHGGELFKAGTAEPNLNNAKGVAALNMMKAMTEYMNPDFLTHDSNANQALWEGGKIALVHLWGSRAGAVTDGENSTSEIENSTKFAGALTVGGGSTPASALWWDGFVIAANIPDADAEATFRALANGVSLKMAQANKEKANWIIKGATPTAAGVGVSATAQAGAHPYPMVPFISSLHGAIGSEIVDFLQGKESAEQALSDVEAAYITVAKEKGFL